MKKKIRIIIPPLVAFFLCFYLINMNLNNEKSTFNNVSSEEEIITEKKDEISPISNINKEFIVPEKEDTKKKEEIQTKEEEIIEKEVNYYVIQDLQCILQNPELPTGCEVTSLAIVFNYLGIEADKIDLADNYLIKGNIGGVTPYEAFLGNPRSKSSYGCYSPVITQTANNYLDTIDSIYIAEDISGKSFEDILKEISMNQPIIIWITIDLCEPYYTTTWNINGEDFTWKANEHCVVLYGFDKENNIAFISDPLKGNMEYDLNRIQYLYEEMYSQAVIIH